MCRFLLVKTTVPSKPQTLLEKFANKTKDSRAPNGDLQEDGWGISWWENNTWKSYFSLSPIWESINKFKEFPKTNIFLVHARSASFIKDKGKISHNQPYSNKKNSFVFNGLLKGMAFPRPLSGNIGAQKIWSLFEEFTKNNSMENSIEKSTIELNKYANEVQALNIGLSDGENIYAYCQFNQNPEYYTLLLHNSGNMKLICSEPLKGFDFSPLEPRKIYTF